MPSASADRAAPSLAVIDDPAELRAFTRFFTDASGRRVASSSFQLSGLYCGTCAGTIEAALQRVDGVLEARVSGAAQRATVRWDLQRASAAALVQAVRAAGYGAVPDTAAEARALRLRERRAATWRFFVAAFCAMQVMMFATPSYLAGPGELEPDLKQLLDWGSWVLTLPVMLFCATPFVRGAWRALRQRTIGMDVPVALGVIVAFIASTGATFSPGGWFGSDVYFDSLSMFLAFLLGARWLETMARHRAAESLESGHAKMPDSVQRLRDDGSVESVSAQRLVPGDRVRVPVGAAFPADGLLQHGATAADEAMLSGESRPVPKAPGATLLAGSLNLQAPVEMVVQRIGADTRLEAITALMREALTQRPALARSADRWAAPFLWSVLALAALAGLAWSFIAPAKALAVVVAVLIVTCPCALSLSVPSALLAAAGALARRGVLLRRLDALEPLAQASEVFVDKTGTLTHGGLRWRGLQRLAPEHDRPRQPSADAAPMQDEDAALLARAASLAAWSTHPLAAALAAAAPQAGAAQAWRAVEERAGSGVQALDEAGRRWRLGSRRFAAGADDAGHRGAPDDTTVAAAAERDHPAAWLGRDERLLARFDFDETLRDGSREAVEALHAEGLKLTLLSGDAAARAATLAAALGLDGCAGGLLPQDKLDAVRAAQRQGARVVMIGDGINDAPVLAQADVSFAMGEGALVARANADAVVLGGSLQGVADARQLAQRTMRIVRQNLLWAAAYNATCVPLAVVGLMPPWASGLGMALSSLAVIGNSLRLSR